MQCPVCKSVNLVMSERQGIEIDYCPQCRGVWLDRGELDKIIERSASLEPAAQRPTSPASLVQQPGAYQHQQPYPGHYKKKKREGFFEDLFDF
ncbi:MAG: zf-TFIIB domain-containing protein [Thiobacillus sp.]|nr:zf-TFIIB domain-containing protein [Thiobacillus sp.]